MEVELFEDDHTTHDLNADPGAWYTLTDQYAAALGAMERGEPDGRRRVMAAYQKLKQMPAPAGTHNEGA